MIARLRAAPDPYAARIFARTDIGARMALIWCGLFLLLLSARLFLVARTASVLPFWDEWDSDVIALFLPPWRGAPSLDLIVAHHNEHLIALTRLYDLGLFWAEHGHWHILTETVINQVYYCAFAVGLVAWLSRTLPLAYLGCTAAGSACVLFNPYGWEAVSWAFESQIYFCIILSVLAFLLISAGPANKAAFWCGVGAALASAVAFGTGMVTLPTAALLVAARHFAGRQRLAASAAVALLLAALTATVMFTPYGNDLHHQASLRSLAATAAKILSWPRGLHSPGLAYWPALIFLSAGCTHRHQRGTLFWFTAAICVWEGLIALQLAVSRPDAAVTSRYTEFFAVGIVVNLACAMHLAARVGLPAGAARAAACAAWVALIALGYHARLPDLRDELANKRRQDDVQEFDVARFIRTGDPITINAPAPIPYHTPAMLALRLKQGEASGILSASLRDGDTPRRGKWRKTLARWADAACIAGGILLAAGFASLPAYGCRTRRRAAGVPPP